MDPNVRFLPSQRDSYNDLGKYRLVVKLNYLTKTTNVFFPITVISHYLNSPCHRHWNVVAQILGCIKGLPGQGLVDTDKSNANIIVYTNEYWEDPE